MKGLNTFSLKMIAIISMLIDHIGHIFFPEVIIFRIIGRIAFPIFAYVLAEGIYYTKDITKYMLRLGIFALLSEIPYDLAIMGSVLEFSHQNIFFTLVLSLILLKKLEEQQGAFQKILWFAIIAMLAEIIACDYGTGGVLTVLIFYQYRNNRTWMSLYFALTHMLVWGTLGIQSYAALALIPILLYNRKQGPRVKYAFYVFYPMHLLVLGILAHWIKGVQFWSVFVTG